jgi:hypothetical protein
MRPAITEVRVFMEDNIKKATVVGPIDLEPSDSPFAESDVYLWTRVSRDDPHNASTTQGGEPAEAVGADEMDLEQISRTVDPGSTGSQPAMWEATVPVTEGAFSDGNRVFVEAWALVRTKNRQREFHVYWYDTDVPVVQGTAPSRSPAATSVTA